MKAINTQGSYPGMDDGLIIYTGETPVFTGLLGQARQYKIVTDIRTNFFASIVAQEVNTGKQMSIPIVTSIYNTCYEIIFQVPSGYKSMYFITGSVNKQESISKELQDMGTYDYTHVSLGHLHDDISGSKITPMMLRPDAGANSLFVGVSASGLYMQYYTGTQISSSPVFTLPALNNPADRTLLSQEEVYMFNWDAATHMTNTDHYHLFITDMEDPEFLVDITLNGDVLSYGVDTASHGLRHGGQYAWQVQAVNTIASAVTEWRNFGIVGDYVKGL